MSEPLTNGRTDESSLARNKLPFWPALSVLLVVLAMAVTLRLQGRTWFCACQHLMFWSSDVWSRHNSQHLLDPYSFTHLLHGVVFCGLLKWLAPRWPAEWRFTCAVAIECLWEVLENSQMVIERYRAATAAIGYEGDSIVNSLGDCLVCALGFAVARRLGWTRSIVLFVLIEIVLLFWIRDNLTLNVVMLLFPIEGVKAWQLGG
jgi:hypothetical protein